MNTHPFEPQISNRTKKLLVGTLPPEDVRFYFSNSSNTRLWDILIAINNGSDNVGKGGNTLDKSKKIEILDNLNIGISDVIYKYVRDDRNSTKDLHIDPKEYRDLLKLADENKITELLFVYQSAFKWFVHSLTKGAPERLNKLHSKHEIGPQSKIEYEGRIIKTILLPSPLNRGRKGESLDFKLDFYRKHILDKKSKVELS